jgi:VWFA-related protein
MRAIATTFAAGFLMLMVAPTGPGQVVEAQQGGRERTVFVSATDQQGEPVSDLTSEDFVVREDGSRREVLRVSLAGDPIDIALIVDNSTAVARHLVSMREGLTRFVEAMSGGNNIALVGLADRPTILTDYTRDVSRLKAGIGRVFAQPGSAMTLLDALVEVSRGMNQRTATRAALVAVLSDGPEYGRFDDRSVIEAVDQAGASLHAVTVGAFSDVLSENTRYRSIVLEEGTRRSGGHHDRLLVATGIPAALDRVARSLSQQYKVVYARPESLIPPETVEVSMSRPGLTARGTPARRAGE